MIVRLKGVLRWKNLRSNFVLKWKAFQNHEEWCLPFFEISFRSEDIKIFVICKLVVLWRHTLNNTQLEKLQNLHNSGKIWKTKMKVGTQLELETVYIILQIS